MRLLTAVDKPDKLGVFRQPQLLAQHHEHVRALAAGDDCMAQLSEGKVGNTTYVFNRLFDISYLTSSVAPGPICRDRANLGTSLCASASSLNGVFTFIQIYLYAVVQLGCSLPQTLP